MANPLVSLLTGRRATVEAFTPTRTLSDVVLPAETRQTLEQALAQVRNHSLIFRSWGLGEKHTSGRGLTFNFAGPPGTGKTICAEAIAHAVGMRLLVVNYSETQSMWVGETPKNIAAVFRAATTQNAVLLFDEADAIATRRATGSALAYDREMNLSINVLLRELEGFNGIVIFATNLAANFDPAFERRIRTHVLFQMPGLEERSRIWQLQIHPQKTPLSSDVDFHRLAERFAVSGGDIKNAVIKAAGAAASEPGPDSDKKIQQRHFEAAMEEVVSAKTVMQQSLMPKTGAVEDVLLEQIAVPHRAVTAAIVLAGTSIVVSLVALIVAIMRAME